jgi:osmotically-inducible protein OsmY
MTTTTMTTRFRDRDIRREVRRLLRWDRRLDATRIRVEVTEGTVRLAGVVPDREASLTATRIAAGVTGVCGVVNQLEERRGAPSTEGGRG